MLFRLARLNCISLKPYRLDNAAYSLKAHLNSFDVWFKTLLNQVLGAFEQVVQHHPFFCLQNILKYISLNTTLYWILKCDYERCLFSFLSFFFSFIFFLGGGGGVPGGIFKFIPGI